MKRNRLQNNQSPEKILNIYVFSSNSRINRKKKKSDHLLLKGKQFYKRMLEPCKKKVYIYRRTGILKSIRSLNFHKQYIFWWILSHFPEKSFKRSSTLWQHQKKDSLTSEYNKPYLRCRGQEFLIVGGTEINSNICAREKLLWLHRKKKKRINVTFSFYYYSYSASKVIIKEFSCSLIYLMVYWFLQLNKDGKYGC